MSKTISSSKMFSVSMSLLSSLYWAEMNLYKHPEPSRKFEFKGSQRFTMTLVIMLMIFF